MQKRKIKKGDKVMVVTGKDKGRVGTILSMVNGGEKVLVEGANTIKRHTRGNPQQQIPGGIFERESPIHISNVALFNEATGKRDRVGYKMLENGKKMRIFKSTGEMIDLNKTVG